VFHKQKEVLGPVGSLVTVDDDIACHLLSWILGKRLNVLVTTTRRAADEEAKRRQVMCLETVRAIRSNCPWMKPVSPLVAEYQGQYLLHSVIFPVG
jgi:hypothetical protein